MDMDLVHQFVDGQISCPECGKVFFARGAIGDFKTVPYHNQCIGGGGGSYLDPLTDPDAIDQCRNFHSQPDFL